MVYCLYNGEYGEHDLSKIDNIETIIRLQDESYENKIGLVVGDYICDKIEYDWGRRDQRWTCHCTKCGTIIYQYHAKDWVRCHGRTIRCSVCREKERDEKKKTYREEVAKRKRLREEEQRRKLEESKRRAEQRVNYSDKKWIGVRNGHAVTIGRNGKKFVLRCDCGREFEKYPYAIFVRKNVVDCGDAECQHYIERSLAFSIIEAGNDFEDECENALDGMGYDVKHVGKTGDFGVDLIAAKDGVEIAIQCKNWDAPVGVKAVQEVYAGGRYYGNERFAVISRTGYTAMAVEMAAVLGVYLCDNADNFDYKADINENAIDVIPILNAAKGRHIKKYEMNGKMKSMAEWCMEYGVSSKSIYAKMNQGRTFEQAVYALVNKESYGKKYTVNGFTGNLREIGEKFGVLPQTIQYRMKYRNMTIEEAVFQKFPKEQKGKPC